MDVHSLKMVLIGIDPYPFLSTIFGDALEHPSMVFYGNIDLLISNALSGCLLAERL